MSQRMARRSSLCGYRRTGWNLNGQAFVPSCRQSLYGLRHRSSACRRGAHEAICAGVMGQQSMMLYKGSRDCLPSMKYPNLSFSFISTFRHGTGSILAWVSCILRVCAAEMTARQPSSSASMDRAMGPRVVRMAAMVGTAQPEIASSSALGR